MMNQSDDEQIELTKQAILLLKNLHVLVKMLDTNRRFFALTELNCSIKWAFRFMMRNLKRNYRPYHIFQKKSK